MPSAPVNALSDTSTADAPSAKFHQDLANGLHAMAQPLTMLRAAIEVLGMPLSVGIDRQKYLEVSAGAVERACDLFGRIQDLVAVSMVEAEKVPFDLWSIVANVVEEQRASLQASGAAIAATKAEDWKPILGDADRTEQAIVLVLRLAGELARAGDVIEVSGSSSRAFVELRIEISRRRGRPIDSTARLNLALAEANIASQRGRYEFVEDPFRVSLILPLADRGQWENERDVNCRVPQSMH